MIRELDDVVLRTDLPPHGLTGGDVGTVVLVHRGGAGYDVEFTAPKYQNGKKTANARVLVKHNGVVIHPEFELSHATPGRKGEGPAPRPFYLQGHGNKIEYRNIWVVEKK
jgi:hypothetical protein